MTRLGADSAVYRPLMAEATDRAMSPSSLAPTATRAALDLAVPLRRYSGESQLIKEQDSPSYRMMSPADSEVTAVS